VSGTETTVHASCVAIAGRAVLLRGVSGAGKSDLVLRLVDRGACLVSDDRTTLCAAGDRLRARPPERIAGKLEIRGVGIVDLPCVSGVPLCLVAELDAVPERMPEPGSAVFLGLEVPSLALAPLEPSAPVKLEWALRRFGLPLP
jgi:serine kinase of HPr protein (carbohydrate metabolism regulator)